MRKDAKHRRPYFTLQVLCQKTNNGIIIFIYLFISNKGFNLNIAAFTHIQCNLIQVIQKP